MPEIPGQPERFTREGCSEPDLRYASIWKTLVFQRHPKYWLLGLVLLLCCPLAKLPYAAQLACGRGLGRLIYLTAQPARGIALANIRLCFPHLDADKQKRLLAASFRELGITAVETVFTWFGDIDNFYREKVTIKGMEHWRAAQKQNKGILLLSCHYGSPDLNALLMSRLSSPRPFAYTYKRPSDSLIDRLSRILRSRVSKRAYPVQCLKSAAYALKRKGVVWCAPDIEVCETQGVFANFMGVPAVTSVLASRLSQMTDAIVLPCAHYRNDNSQGYTLKIYPAINNFPSSDPVADARAQNRQVEQILSTKPECYLWIIKRFRRRPEGQAPVY